MIFVQNLSPLNEAAEGADFLKIYPDPVGVAGEEKEEEEEDDFRIDSAVRSWADLGILH